MEHDYVFNDNPTEQTSVAIDGVRLADIGVHLLSDSEEPLLPDVRDYSVTIPGRHGAYDFGAYFHPRNFTLSCGINNQASLYHVQQITRNLSSLLLDRYGRPKEVTLEYDYDRGREYRARLANGVPIDRIVRAGFFQIPMIAHDPFAYSTHSSEEVTWGRESITFEFSYLLGHEGTGGGISVTSPTTHELYIDGYAIKPVFDISGSASRLTVEANGHSFELPAFSNEDWTIDFERYTVLRNGENSFDDVILGEFELVPGLNEVRFGGSGIDVDVRIKFRDKYM